MTFGLNLLTVIQYVCQIIFLAVPLYFLMVFLQRTRGYHILYGLFGIFIVMLLVARILRLEETSWLLEHAVTYLPLILIVIFQPELRRIFAEIGSRTGIRGETPGETAADSASQLARAIDSLSSQRIGAIIAIERKESLDVYTTSGRKLGVPIIADLIECIFYPGTTLHDGGMIIRDATIAFAGCIFPLPEVEDVRRPYGTRHRAAIGLTEKSDAIVIVVSEETGLISIAYHGHIERGLSADSVKRIAQVCFGQEEDAETALDPDAADGSIDPVTQVISDIRQGN